MGSARYWLVVLGPLLLAGCGGDEPPPVTNFAPLEYGYLLKLRLNVANVSVEDHSVPYGASDVAGQSPTPPAQALAAMARERLFPAGVAGQAIFTIDQASIIRDPSGALNGQLVVHLQIIDGTGRQAATAEARVARQHVPGSDEEDLRAVLYDMTKQMMADMNVELEFQIRRSMGAWLITASDVPSSVTATPLTQSGAPPVPPAPMGGTTLPPPASPYQLPAYPPPPPQAPYQPSAPLPPEPPAYPQPDSSQAPQSVPPPEPLQMSPPPGFLQAPHG